MCILHSYVLSSIDVWVDLRCIFICKQLCALASKTAFQLVVTGGGKAAAVQMDFGDAVEKTHGEAYNFPSFFVRDLPLPWRLRLDFLVHMFHSGGRD